MDIKVEYAKCPKCNKKRQLPFQPSIYFGYNELCHYCNKPPRIKPEVEFHPRYVHKDDLEGGNWPYMYETWISRFKLQKGRCQDCRKKVLKLRMWGVRKQRVLLCFRCFYKRNVEVNQPKREKPWWVKLPKWQKMLLCANPFVAEELVQKEVDPSSAGVIESTPLENSNYA